MRAYYFDNIPGDQRLAHDSGKPVSADTLKALGVLHWQIPLEQEGGWEATIDAVARERSYKNRDTINVTKEGLGDLYETKLKSFFEEHMHEDEEIRYILSGAGFFDVREHPTDAWIRIHVLPGDLLVVPAGIYHRFTLDELNQIKALRLFKVRISFSAPHCNLYYFSPARPPKIILTHVLHNRKNLNGHRTTAAPTPKRTRSASSTSTRFKASRWSKEEPCNLTRHTSRTPLESRYDAFHSWCLQEVWKKIRGICLLDVYAKIDSATFMKIGSAWLVLPLANMAREEIYDVGNSYHREGANMGQITQDKRQSSAIAVPKSTGPQFRDDLSTFLLQETWA
ncbi:hypothetical protein EW146_g4549 [Bondarzewia mesenterica]|uniref:Acireductone dioxygenase n=1 Tax=Bondarzewia mesenterica TaxID=1095465 RepID=A0A4S4LU97_9AGAM|nr:hypothetical protein EW146_g4549 [Bondarzewia mesenterica]